MKRKDFQILTLIFLLMQAFLFCSAVEIGLEKGANKYSLAVVPFEGDFDNAEALRKIIIQDLTSYQTFVVYTKKLENLAKPLYSIWGKAIDYDSFKKARIEYVCFATVKKKNDKISVKCTLLDVNAKGKIFTVAYSASEKHIRALAHRCSHELYYNITAKKPAFSSKVTFVSTASGKTELFEMDWDGHNIRQITQERALLMSPGYADNGKYILYTSYKDINPDLYRLNRKTGKSTRIAAYPMQNLGADYSSKSKSVLLTLGKDGNPEIYKMDLNGKNLTRLTKTPRVIESSPTWSKNGKEFAFTTNRNGSPQIYRYTLKTGRMRRITRSGGYNTEADWSSNNQIVYTTKKGKNFQICTVDRDGSNVEILTSGPFDHEQPCWSADGEFIYYTSSQDGIQQVYRMRKDGSDKRRLTISKAKCKTPACSSPLY